MSDAVKGKNSLVINLDIIMTVFFQESDIYRYHVGSGRSWWLVLVH